MLQRCKAITAAAVLAGAGLLGCQDGQWSDSVPENQGYRWVGEGEPGNYGSAYTFCQSTLREANAGARLEGGGGIATSVPGGPSTIPGYDRTQQVYNPNLSSVTNRRQFQGCMASQGWAVPEQASAPPVSPPPAVPKPQ